MDLPPSDDSWLNPAVSEFFPAVLQVILLSRSPSSGVAASRVCSRDGRFNSQIRECPAGVENVSGALCCSDAGTMVVDVILVKRSLDYSPRTPLAGKSASQDNGKVIERWVLHHDAGKGKDSAKCKKWSRGNTVSAVCERLMLLMRSLYAMVRLLPAYKTSRDIASSNNSCLYSLSHRVSSFAEPFNNKEDKDFKQFGFAPVNIMNGRLCLSVLYLASALDLSSYPSAPLSQRIIPNYIGSAFADLLKRFPLLADAHLHEPPLIRTGSAPVSAIPCPPLDGAGHDSKKTKRIAHVIKSNPAIEKGVHGRRNGSMDKHGDMMPWASFTQISFVRCYRQYSWQDFDYTEITCPFDVDDSYNLSDISHRPQSSDGQGHEHQHDKQGSDTSWPNQMSQNAFVGALVYTLQRAPPLREELQHSLSLPEPSSDAGIGFPKTTADAMEELKSYSKMKCLFLGC